MGTIYARGKKLYVGFKDASDKWQYKSSGFVVGQEKQAEKLLEHIEAQVEAEKRFATSEGDTKPRGPVTLKMFAQRWLKDRERRRIADVTRPRPAHEARASRAGRQGHRRDSPAPHS